MECILFRFLKYFFHCFSILWKCILNKPFITADGGFSVYWKQYSFIHIFFKPLLQLESAIFKKSYFCLWKPFSAIFHTLIWMEAVFRSSEISFFNKSFILVYGNKLSVNYKPCAELFPLVDIILEIRCKPISFNFFLVPNRGSSFYRLVETDFSSNTSFQRVETDFDA